MRRSFVVVGLAFLIMLIFAAIYLPTLSRYRNLRMQQDRIEHEIDVLDEKIKALMEEKALLQNDVQYIEKIIRDQMGLVKPGEVVYKFITDTVKPPKVKNEVLTEEPADLALEPSAPAAKTENGPVPALSQAPVSQASTAPKKD